MDDQNSAAVRALARAREPVVPACQSLHHRAQPPGINLHPRLDQAAQDRACDRRLGDAAGGDRLTGGPDVWTGEVAFVITAEDDVRDHAVGPLRLEQ